MVACSGTPSAADYDQTCKVDTDCIGVVSGSCDGLCACPTEAINKSQSDKYAGDLEKSGCHVSACACPASAPACESGLCVLKTSGTQGTGGSSSTSTGG